MKRLLLFLLLLASPCAAQEQLAWMGPVMAGGGVAATASCTSGLANVTQSQGTSDQEIQNTANGQGFKVTSSGDLYSFVLTVTVNIGETTKTITLRYGTSTSLSSSYEEELSANITAGYTGTVEFVSTTHPALATDTQYYVGWKSDAAIYLKYKNSDVYADGTYLYANAGGWDLGNSLSDVDFAFVVKLCN